MQSARPSPERLRLLASAIAGRPVEVVATTAEEHAWTDGGTIHLPAVAERRDEMRMVVLQASLIAAGSLDAEVLARLGRRPSLARRYLTLEGHRALSASEALLPAAVRELIDDRTAASASTPQGSLAAARGRTPIDDPPRWFGALEPRRVLEASDREPSPPGRERSSASSSSTDARDLIDL